MFIPVKLSGLQQILKQYKHTEIKSSLEDLSMVTEEGQHRQHQLEVVMVILALLVFLIHNLLLERHKLN